MRHFINELAKVLTAFLALSLCLTAQTNNSTQWNLQSGSPGFIQSVNGSPQGQPGGTTVFYWVVPIFPAGWGQASGPVAVARTVGFSNFNSSNFVVVSWSPVDGATGYTVYRSENTSNPLANGLCSTCGVVSNTTATNVQDQNPVGIALVQGTAITPSTLNMTINNTGQSSGPFVNAQFNFANYRLGLLAGSWVANDCIKINSGGFLASAGAACGSGTGGGGAATSITPVALIDLPLGCLAGDVRYVTNGTTTAGGWRLYFCDPNGTWVQSGVVAGPSNTMIVTSSDFNRSQVEANPATVEIVARKGVANGYASLDGSGLVPTSQLPPSASFTTTDQGFWLFGLPGSANTTALTQFRPRYFGLQIVGGQSFRQVCWFAPSPAATGNMRVGLYNSVGTLIAQTADVANSAGTVVCATFSPAVSITPQYCYIALISDSLTGGVVITSDNFSTITGLVMNSGSTPQVFEGPVQANTTLPGSVGLRTAYNPFSNYMPGLWARP